MKKYKCYLFDFDGTLLDSAESMVVIFQHAFRKIGLDCTADEAYMFMLGSLERSIEYKHVPQKDIQPYIEAIIEGLELPEAYAKIRLFPETLNLLNTLDLQGNSIGIVSSNGCEHIKNVFRYFNIKSDSLCIIGHEHYKNSKPNPEPILVAMSKFPNLSKNDFVYVGDSLNDVAAAKNAGIDGVLIDRDNKHSDFEGIRISSLLELL